MFQVRLGSETVLVPYICCASLKGPMAEISPAPLLL